VPLQWLEAVVRRTKTNTQAAEMTFDLILLKLLMLLMLMLLMLMLLMLMLLMLMLLMLMLLMLMLRMLMLLLMKETSETVLQHQLVVQMPDLVFPILIQVEYALQPS
jgi:hypothetical protein